MRAPDDDGTTLGLPMAVLHEHLAILKPLLVWGCDLGHHRTLAHLRRNEVEALLAWTAPRYTPAQTHAAFRAAGPDRVYGAVFHAYVRRVELLDRQGAETRPYKAWLRALLATPARPSPGASAGLDQ